jgi:hypothetical protein
VLQHATASTAAQLAADFAHAFELPVMLKKRRSGVELVVVVDHALTCPRLMRSRSSLRAFAHDDEHTVVDVA